MTSTNTSDRPTVGVVGAGAFGSAVANLLADLAYAALDPRVGLRRGRP